MQHRLATDFYAEQIGNYRVSSTGINDNAGNRSNQLEQFRNYKTNWQILYIKCICRLSVIFQHFCPWGRRFFFQQ